MEWVIFLDMAINRYKTTMKLSLFSPFAKLLIFIGLIFLFMGIFSVLFPLAYLYLSGGDVSLLLKPDAIVQDWAFLCNMQLWTSICVFLAPSLLAAYWFSDGKTGEYLFSKRVPLPAQCLMAIVLLLAITPMISLIGEWNYQLRLPDALSGMEAWMRRQEDAAQEVVNQILNVESSIDWLFVLLVLAISAGITEEFLFRGVMQRLLLEKFKRVHLAVWITAFVFSAIHLQFFGFFPRILLGALCGYLLVWSGNIWIPVLVHTLNNAIYVATEYAIKQGWTTTEAMEMELSWGNLVIALAALVVFFLVAQRFKNRQQVPYRQTVLAATAKSIFEKMMSEEINRTSSDEK